MKIRIVLFLLIIITGGFTPAHSQSGGKEINVSIIVKDQTTVLSWNSPQYCSKEDPNNTQVSRTLPANEHLHIYLQGVISYP